jgi:hypothetical protein
MHLSNKISMKTKALFLLLAVTVFSCAKDVIVENLSAKYQPICSIWKPVTMSYDSMDVRVTHPIQYEKLVINNDLTYEIFLDATNPSIEDGMINIITQTDNKLELFFDAQYPGYSSFAGSHIFGFSNVTLDSLSNDVLVFKSSEDYYFQNVIFNFRKYE